MKFTKKTTASKLLTACAALVVASCGFNRSNNDFGDTSDINYRDYVDMASVSLGIQDGKPSFNLSSEGFGLTALTCSEVNIAVLNSVTGFNDTYTGPTGAFELDIVKNDPVDFKINSITCATGSGGANEAYTWSSQDNYSVNGIAVMTTAGDAKTMKLKYLTSCDQGDCAADMTFRVSASGYELNETATNVVKAEFGNEISFNVSGLSAPDYKFREANYKSTDQGSGFLKFAMGWECNAVGSPAVNAADVDDNGNAKCSGETHVGHKVVWLDKNGAWANTESPTESEINTDIDALAGDRIITTVAGDQVDTGKSGSSRTGVTDATGLTTNLDQDGLAVDDVKTADSFYSQLTKFACIYKEQTNDNNTPGDPGDDFTERGIKCQKITFAPLDS